MRILTGDDRATEFGDKSYERMVKRMSKKADVPWNGIKGKVAPVQAYINGGRWLARCDACGSVFYVTPSDPFFYCLECGNEQLGGNSRPVTFPSDDKREKIELLLRRRPVQLRKKKGRKTQLAAGALPLTGLRRDWYPGTEVSELKAANAAAGISNDDSTPIVENEDVP